MKQVIAVVLLLVAACFVYAPAQAGSKGPQKTKVFFVHGGAVAAACADGKVECIHAAMGTLEIRFYPNKGVKKAAAWDAVSQAYGGNFYGAMEDSVCSRDLETAQYFATDVRETLRKAKVPVHSVEVYFHCRPHP